MLVCLLLCSFSGWLVINCLIGWCVYNVFIVSINDVIMLYIVVSSRLSELFSIKVMCGLISVLL